MLSLGGRVIHDDTRLGNLRVGQLVDQPMQLRACRHGPDFSGRVAVELSENERPDIHEDDSVPGRERFFRRDLDPRRWLRVVVDYGESPGFVVTAFVQDHKPESAP